MDEGPGGLTYDSRMKIKSATPLHTEVPPLSTQATMNTDTIDKAWKEIEATLNAHGIGTFIVVMKSPDSDLEHRSFGGSQAWVAGHATLLVDLVCRRRNADEAP